MPETNTLAYSAKMVNGIVEYAYNSDTNSTAHIRTIIYNKLIIFSYGGMEV